VLLAAQWARQGLKRMNEVGSLLGWCHAQDGHFRLGVDACVNTKPKYQIVKELQSSDDIVVESHHTQTASA
jgi:hypothetical protein